jgi:uncharacterized protein (TIGR02271 family)
VREHDVGGGGESRPPTEPEDQTIVLHEEQATVGKRWEGVGYARVRREVTRENVRADYPRQRERIAHERVPVGEGDSGKIETLADGSISIPLFEEELVVTRRTVLRERVIIRKEHVTEWQTVEADLRKERLRFDTDDVPKGSVRGIEAFADRPGRRRPRPLIETKPFFLTSEFILAFAGWLALLLTTLATDALDAWTFFLLTVAIAVGYMLSRGAAKAHTPSHAWDPRDELQRRT